MTDFAYKLGKKPATYNPKTFRFADYKVDGAALSTTLPQPKFPFGHGNTFTDWGMLGNDEYGCCVPSGSDHEEMLIENLSHGDKPNVNVVTFTTDNTLADYFAMNGVPPGPPGSSSDQGTNVQDALSYRRKTGMIDASGVRHQIGAYVSIEPGNIQDILDAIWIFEAVGIGFEFPSSAMDQFNAGQVWSYVRGSQIEGGHYVPLVGAPNASEFAFVTWGKRTLMTTQFFSKYCDEAYAYVSLEELNAKQKNANGFNWAQLQADLAAL